MAINDKLDILQKDINYRFNDLKLLRLALTHKSYAYEMKRTEMNDYNERIEYLGDAILEHIISDFLFNLKPMISEGQMTKKRAEIVCEKSLSDAFKQIKGNEYIFLGKCETINHGYNKPAIIADAFESLIGAIYVDGGFEKAREVALKLLSKTIESSIKGDTEIVDYKSLLQERLQEQGNVNIQYNLVKETGPDHKKVFHTEVLINDVVEGFGIGKTRKISEQKAAEVAYAKYI